jgi:hypothetical protein
MPDDRRISLSDIKGPIGSANPTQLAELQVALGITSVSGGLSNFSQVGSAFSQIVNDGLAALQVPPTDRTPTHNTNISNYNALLVGVLAALPASPTTGARYAAALQTLPSATRVGLFLSLITNTSADEDETIGLALSSLLTRLPQAQRGNLLVGLAEDMITNGQVWRTNDGGNAVTGVSVGLDEAASQQDILTGDDIFKVVTAESVGGLMLQRNIAYASTVSIDFTGLTPPWSFENVISCTGAIIIQANLFTEYMIAKEFTIHCVRASGTGNVTVQNKSGGANVDYRDGLTSASIPALGTTVGDSVTLRAKVMATNLWRIEAVESA